MEGWMVLGCVAMVLLMVNMSNSHASSPYPYWITVDCGAENTSVDGITGKTWYTDEQFINTGENKLISINTNVTEMNTLRFFDKAWERNCYGLPLLSQSKYLIRTGFYYGNYNSLQNPPVFDLEIDGSLRLTIDTSLSEEPIYHEVIHFTKRDNTDICLMQTHGSQVPFISSIEAMYVYKEMYTLMEGTKLLYLESRINYGANQSVPSRFNQNADLINRIWKPEQPSSKYRNRFSGYEPDSYAYKVENNPPYKVLVYAIEAKNMSESIFLPIKFHENSMRSAYFAFYFWELPPWPPTNLTRKLSIHIDSELKNVTELNATGDPVTVSIYPVNVTGTANVTISAAEGSTLPPLVNAMEVYSAMDDLPTSEAGNLMGFSWILMVSPVVVFVTFI